MEREVGKAGVRREVIALVEKVLAHDLTQLSAALTYYTVLSLLPALLVVVSLLGIFGLSSVTVHELFDTLGELGALWAADAVSAALDSVTSSESSGAVFTISLVFSLWAASAYVGSFMAASDRIYEIANRRPFWTGLPLRVGLALLLLVLLSATAAVLTLVGPIGVWIAEATGIGTESLGGWGWIKWPLLAVLALLQFALLYKYTPSRRQPALWWLLPGAVVGVSLWLIGSAGFGFYLDNFASYNRVYGTLATVVVFLVWVWLMNIALLVGAEVNREVELRRAGGSDLPGAAASGPDPPASV